jgi:hypothetical protein
MTDDDRDTDRFQPALREWARKPPGTPAAVAGQRVAARIAAARPRSAWTGTWAPRLAAACAVTVVLAGVLVWRTGPLPPTVSPVVDAPPVLPENVVVFWLDAETPVYFVVAPLGDSAGGTP